MRLQEIEVCLLLLLRPQGSRFVATLLLDIFMGYQVFHLQTNNTGSRMIDYDPPKPAFVRRKVCALCFSDLPKSSATL